MSDTSRLPVLLDDMERRFLRAALLDLSEPAQPTDELAVVMGFTSADSLPSEAWALWKRIEAGQAMTSDTGDECAGSRDRLCERCRQFRP